MDKFTQSAEWWRTPTPDGRTNAQLSTWELQHTYGGVGRQGWDARRRRGKERFGAEVMFPALSSGHPSAEMVTTADERIVAPADVPLTIEEKVARDREVLRLTNRVSELERRYDAALREGDIEGRLCEAFDLRAPKLAAPGVPTFSPRNPGKHESAVALLSDAHIGEVVDSAETGGLNAYDFDLFSSRFQYYVDGIGGICFGKLTGYDFPELVVIGLGDMVSGVIHDELVETSDGTLIDWLIDGSWVLAQGIRQLAAEFPSVRVEWHFGNHGRVTQKVRYKRRWVNYDYLLGHMIARELADIGNVTFTNHKSFWSVVDVQGHGLLNLHGDNIKGWAGLPSYGINRAVANLEALLAQQRRGFDLVNLGHFHQTGLIERIGCDVVLNGSIIGGNEYSYGALFAGAKPRQVIYGVHPERGRTWQFALDLAHGDAHECRFGRP